MEAPVITELFAMLSDISFWLTFLGVSAIPYAMYLVAYIGESRRPGRGPNDVPVWIDQSRAFMPGDFGLALMVAVCLRSRTNVTVAWMDTWWFALCSLAVGLLVFLWARHSLYTPSDYSIVAWNSPSKRYHDFVMFLLFTAVAIYVCVPVYIATDWTTSFFVKLLSVFGLSLWIVGNIYDFTHTETPNNRQHPTEEYQPIWRKVR